MNSFFACAASLLERNRFQDLLKSKMETKAISVHRRNPTKANIPTVLLLLKISSIKMKPLNAKAWIPIAATETNRVWTQYDVMKNSHLQVVPPPFRLLYRLLYHVFQAKTPPMTRYREDQKKSIPESNPASNATVITTQFQKSPTHVAKQSQYCLRVWALNSVGISASISWYVIG